MGIKKTTTSAGLEQLMLKTCMLRPPPYDRSFKLNIKISNKTTIYTPLFKNLNKGNLFGRGM